MTKVCPSFVATNTLLSQVLSWQTHFFQVLLWQTHLFQVLSQQTHFCYGKHTFIMTTTMFVTTNTFLSQQTRVCRNKILSWQKCYLWQLPPRIVSMVPMLMGMGQINSTFVLNYCSVFHSFLSHILHPTDLFFHCNNNNGNFLKYKSKVWCDIWHDFR